MKKYIGVDIGGTKIHASLIDEKGRIVREIIIRTEASRGRKKVIQNIFSAIESLFSKQVRGIGIGSPGPIDIRKGKILNTPNLPLKNFDLRRAVQKKFRVKTALDNDAKCFVLGEAVYGSGRGKKIVAGLTMGTGIGGGLVLDGKIYHGRGRASEFGHMPINFEGNVGKCGHRGCLESYIGKFAIRKYASRIGIGNPYDLFIAAKKGNKKARKIWRDVGFYLGIGVAYLANIFDPDIIVIGGNVSGAWQFFEKEMKKTVREKSIVGLPRIVKSGLGSKAAILGAARLVME
jgi:glucokinase